MRACTSRFNAWCLCCLSLVIQQASSRRIAPQHGLEHRRTTLQSKYAIPGCTVNHTKPSDADVALSARKYADAERLYSDALTADPASSAAMAGLVRTTLAEGKLPDALALAMKYSSAHPNDAVLLDALGEVRFRRGETDEAGNALNQSRQSERMQSVSPSTTWLAFYIFRATTNGAQRGVGTRLLALARQRGYLRRWHRSHAVPLDSGAASGHAEEAAG